MKGWAAGQTVNGRREKLDSEIQLRKMNETAIVPTTDNQKALVKGLLVISSRFY